MAEAGKDMSIEWKDFSLRLKEQPQEIQDIYNSIYLSEVAKRAKEIQGQPPPVTLTEREEMLKRAVNIENIMRVNPGIEPLKVEKAWIAAHDRKGRPPIGGAKDD